MTGNKVGRADKDVATGPNKATARFLDKEATTGVAVRSTGKVLTISVGSNTNALKKSFVGPLATADTMSTTSRGAPSKGPEKAS